MPDASPQWAPPAGTPETFPEHGDRMANGKEISSGINLIQRLNEGIGSGIHLTHPAKLPHLEESHV